MRVRPKIGDVIEIRTSKGLAYALYTHRHPMMGPLLRVLEGEYAERPPDLSEVVSKGVRFSTFFPLGAAVRRDLVSIAGNVPVPEELKEFPTFRAAGLENPKTGKVDVWWLWDGEREWKVGKLTREQRKLPIQSIVNDTMLIHWIGSGWRPETDRR